MRRGWRTYPKHILRGFGAIVLAFNPSGTLWVQDDVAQAARGRIDLEQIGASWAAGLSGDQNLGIYFGRKWISRASVLVKAAAPADGAAFEAIWNAESKLSGKWMCVRDRIMFTSTLGPVASEVFEDGPLGKVTSILFIQQGRWEIRREQKRIATYLEGTLRPSTRWNASLLPLFLRPRDGPVTLCALDGDQSPVTLTSPPDTFGPGPRPAAVFIEVYRGQGHPGLWRFTRDGRVADFRPIGTLVRFGPVTADGMGKDLQEPLGLSEPAKVLSDVFRSVKRGDRSAVAVTFDFESLAKEFVPGYRGLDPAFQSHVGHSLKLKTPGDLSGAKLRDVLPDESLMDHYFAAASAVWEQDGTVEIRLLGTSGVWTLRRAANGTLKGRWLEMTREDPDFQAPAGSPGYLAESSAATFRI